MNDQEKIKAIDFRIDCSKKHLKFLENCEANYQKRINETKIELRKLGDERALIQTSPLGL